MPKLTPQAEQIVQHKKESVLESLSKGATVQNACRAANIGRTTFYNWLKEDQTFALRVAHTEEAAIQCVEDALFASALSGKVPAQIFFLCNRRPDRWKTVTKLEHGSSSDTDRLDQLKDDQRKLLIKYTEVGFEIPKEQPPNQSGPDGSEALVPDV